MEILQAVRGTRDILPAEAWIWQQVEACARQILQRAGYHEIRTPIFELTDLFARGIGTATDVVGKEMYSFTTRGDKEVSLRPENTAGVVRAFIQHGLHASGDLQRLWYIGPMFRYERPQTGRQRQFHQLGLEVLGSPDPRADAEVIALAMDVLKQVGLKHLVLLINSVGDQDDRQTYRQALMEYLTPFQADLDPDSQDRLTRNPLRILDSKVPKTQEIVAHAPHILDHLSPASKHHFDRVLAQLDQLGLSYQLDHRLVRGLDYYTHTAFEIQSHDLGAQGAVGGGGRYDRLVSELGGPETPAVGWAIGLERLVVLLQKHDPDRFGVPYQPDIYLISRGDLAEAQSLQVAQQLRQAGFVTELDLSGSALNKQFKRASKRGATWAITIGDAEAAAAQVQVKHLERRHQETVAQADLVTYLQTIDLQQGGES